jgi:hypothetical protein
MRSLPNTIPFDYETIPRPDMLRATTSKPVADHNSWTPTWLKSIQTAIWRANVRSAGDALSFYGDPEYFESTLKQ